MNNPALLIASALTIPLSFALSGPANLTHASECPEDAPWCSVDDEIHGGLDDVDFVDVRRAPDPRVYAYTAKCFTEYFTRVADYCDREGYIPEPDMPCDDEEVLAPRWSRPREQSDEHWTLDRTFTCPGDDGFPFSSSDFAALPLAPSPIEIQPNTGWVFAGLETVAFSDESAQGFTVSLLDVPFEVVAIPIDFTWDFGDGTDPLVTTEPGAPWPDQTVSHIYRAEGQAQISLTTRWRGHFRIAGRNTWSSVVGTALTTSSGPAIHIHTARTRLVEDSLD